MKGILDRTHSNFVYIGRTVDFGYKDSPKKCPYNPIVLISGVLYVVNYNFCTTKMGKIRVKLTDFAVLIFEVHCIYYVRTRTLH